MLAGLPATFISPVGPLGGSIDAIPAGRSRRLDLAARWRARNFRRVSRVPAAYYTTYHFHVDFATPANSTFTTFCDSGRRGLYLALPHHAQPACRSSGSLRPTSSMASATV